MNLESIDRREALILSRFDVAPEPPLRSAQRGVVARARRTLARVAMRAFRVLLLGAARVLAHLHLAAQSFAVRVVTPGRAAMLS